MERELITSAEFARRVGVNRKQVCVALQRGRIRAYCYTDNGRPLIDWDSQKKLWLYNRTDNAIKYSGIY